MGMISKVKEKWQPQLVNSHLVAEIKREGLSTPPLTSRRLQWLTKSYKVNSRHCDYCLDKHYEEYCYGVPGVLYKSVISLTSVD